LMLRVSPTAERRQLAAPGGQALNRSLVRSRSAASPLTRSLFLGGTVRPTSVNSRPSSPMADQNPSRRGISAAPVPPWATDPESPRGPPELGITDSLAELLGQHGLHSSFRTAGVQASSSSTAMPPQMAGSSGSLPGGQHHKQPALAAYDRGRDILGGAPGPSRLGGPLGGHHAPGPTPSPPPRGQAARSHARDEVGELGQTAGKRGVHGGGSAANTSPHRAISQQSPSPPPAAPPPWGMCCAGQAAVCISAAADANEEFRPYMEDGHRIIDPLLSTGRNGEDCWGYYSVFDGHGGREETKYCETKMHEVVLAELNGLAPGKDARDALVAAFRKVDSQLAMMGAWNSGCTATVALVHRQAGSKPRLFVANVGDSRAVLVGSGGARRVSTDHRACDAAEARRVAEEGGIVRHGRVGGQLSVSRSLGDHHLKNSGVSCVPDVFACDLASGDNALIIASDGLWDVLDDDEANNVFQGSVATAVGQVARQNVADWLRDNIARTLVKYAKDHGSRDNILALTIFL